MNFDFIPEWLGGPSAVVLGIAIVWYASQVWARLKRVEDRVDDHEKHCAERHKKIDERFNRIDETMGKMKETMGKMKEDIATIKVNLDWLVSQARQGEGAGPPADE